MIMERKAAIRKAIGAFILFGTALLVAMKIAGVTTVSWWMVFILVWIWLAFIIIAFALVGVGAVLSIQAAKRRKERQ